MAEDAFAKLQRLLLSRKKKVSPEMMLTRTEIQNALLYLPESPESFSSFRLALISKKIDSNDLLSVAAVMAIVYDGIFLHHAALALRYGANPNSYVTSKFPIDIDLGSVVILDVPVLLGKQLWDLTPRSAEESIDKDVETFGDYADAGYVLDERSETSITGDGKLRSAVWVFKAPVEQEGIEARYRSKQRTSLDLFCMMALKGLDMDKVITDTKLLMQMNIDATKFAMENPQFFSTLYSQIALDPDPEFSNAENESYLGTMFVEEIGYFFKYKHSLQNVYGVNEGRKQRILKYSFLLDLTEILTLTDVYGIKENLQSMFFFQDTESLRGMDPDTGKLKGVLTRLQSINMISNTNVTGVPVTASQKRLELTLFDWAIRYYTQLAIDTLLELGIAPDYSVRSNIIRASKAIHVRFPALAQILNKSVVDFVKYGYGLSSDQLNELSFSPSTQQAIAKEYTAPSWVQMCRSTDTVTMSDPDNRSEINPDLKEMARQIGMPIGSTKEDICSTFTDLSKQNPTKVKEIIYKVNRDRISVLTTSPTDIITHHKKPAGTIKLVKQGKDGNAPAAAVEVSRSLCSNSETMARPIEDYSDVDRVTYSDGRDTWCFVSDQFSSLLTTGVNPWKKAEDGITNVPIPPEILISMRQKLDLVRSEGLEEKSGSVSDGVDSIFSKKPDGSQRVYDRLADRRLEEFFKFASRYGVPRERFEPLTSLDYQFLSDRVLSEDTQIDVDPANVKLSQRDFADAVLIEINNFSDPDVVGNKIADILSQPIPGQEVEVEEVEVEEVTVEEVVEE